MKNITKFAALFFATVLASSCADKFQDYTPANNDQTSAYEQVSFPKTSASIELDPTEATSYVVTLSRKDSIGALTVPLSVLQNDSNVFIVPENVTFEDTKYTTSFTISFPKAEIGTTYNLQVKVAGTPAVSEWTSNTLYEFDVTRVKWNLLGDAEFAENFWWEGENTVQIYQKDNDHNTFRIMDPFTTMEAALGYLSGRQSKQIDIRILQPGETYKGVDIDQSDLVVFDAINTGYYHTSYGKDVMMYHPSAFSSLRSIDYWKYSKVVAYQKEKDQYGEYLPGQIQLAPYYYMSGVGGWDYTDQDDIVVITFPGYHANHVASLLYNDFGVKDTVYSAAAFKSNATGQKTEVQVNRMYCWHSIDNCDSVFAATYGTLYQIPNMYAEGTPIYFCMNDKKEFTLPSWIALQKTGMKVLTDPIYVKLNIDKCSWDGNVITLNMTFQNADGTQNYGTFDEVVSNITYNTVGTADYSYSQFWSDDDGSPYTVTGYELQQRSDDPTQYRILDWGEGVDFLFTWNKTTNKCTVPAQYIGYTHSTYGDVYVADFFNYGGYSYSDYPCVYDPATDEFTLNVVYFVSAGTFGYGPETMKLHFDSNAKVAKAPKKMSKAARTTRMTLKNNLKKRTIFVAHSTGALAKPSFRKK